MQLLFKNVTLAAPKLGPNPTDIQITDGIITAVGSHIAPEKDTKVVDIPGLIASPGWVDLGVQACDPGYEHREDLHSALKAAAAGGFTQIAVFPNTAPPVHSKSEVLYIRHKTENSPVKCHVIGAVSHDLQGKDLAELYDMHEAGAIAFSDGSKPIQDAGLLLRALQYVQAFGGRVWNQPHHKSLSAGGQMHEGLQSTRLGLKGIPALAEAIPIQRDLSLLEYSGGHLHIHLVSTRKGVELIRAAKRKGLSVTASAAIANIAYTDSALDQFDSNWKVMPPLRSIDDQQALIEGLIDNTIDCLCSNHTPWDTEAKNLEFPYAEFGLSGLETAWPMAAALHAPHWGIDTWVEKIALAPRRILGLELPEIKTGSAADLTFFHPEMEWACSEKSLFSKGVNNPFIGKKVKGKVVGMVRGSHFYLA